MTERTSEQASESQEKSAARPPKEAQAKSGEESAVETTGRSRGVRQDFTVGSIPKHLITFAVPLFLGNALQAAYNTVDSIWVGRYLGSQGLAAVSVSGPVIFALVALVMGIGMATTTLVAQYSGAGQPDMVKRTIATSGGLMLLLGIILSLLGVFLRTPILLLINTPPDVLDMASGYLGVFMAGLLAMFFYNGFSAIMRGLGDSRTPLVYLAYATVLNIILDPFMIFGWGPFPEMGVAGAALATVIAQAVSGILGIRYMVRSGLVKLDRSLLALDGFIAKKLFTIGLPAGVQQVVVSMGMLTLTSIVNRFGSAVMAAFGVGGRLDQFAFMPAMSVGLSVTALVGQNLGAGLHERVKETVKWAAYLTVGITSVVSLVVLVMPGVLISIFNSEPGVLIEGAAYLRIVGSAYVPYALMFMLSGVLRGAGDTVPSMFISLVTLWLVRIPVAAYLSGLMGSRGIWLAIAISPVIGASLNYAYFRSGRWKNKTVVSSRSVPQPSTEAES